jgi:hypothetical protein
MMPERLQQEIEKYKEQRNIKKQLESRWIYMFLMLVEFKEENGHNNVPARYSKYMPLGYWVRRQRLVFNEGKLDPLREHLLKLAGFNFRLLDFHVWDEMFDKLSEFKNQFGHVHITESYWDIQLHNWLVYQRKLNWRSKLEPEKLEALKSLGVDMQNKTLNRWETKFAKLVKFKKEHGHLYVSKFFSADKQLNNFVKVLRRSKDNISIERRKKLDELGFDWNPGMKLTILLNQKRADEIWLKRFEELKNYKAQFGTCRLLAKSKTHPTLGGWVSKQRNNIEKLTTEQIYLFTDIGFFEYNSPRTK